MMERQERKEVFILGAGPAGLSSAYFMEKKGFKVTVIEKSDTVGGLSKGVSFLDQKYDLGPHSFYANYSKETKQFFEQFVGKENYTKVKPEKLIQTKEALFSSPFKFSSLFKGNNVFFFLAYAFFKGLAFFSFSKNKTVIDKHGYWLRKKIFVPYCRKYFNLDEHLISEDFINLLYASDTNTSDDSIYIPHAGYIGKLWEEVHEYLVEKGVTFEFKQQVTQVNCKDGRIVQFQTQDQSFTNISRVISTIPLTLLHGLVFPDSSLKSNLLYRATLIVFIEVEKITTDALYLTNYNLDEIIGRISFCTNWKKESLNQVISAELWCDVADPIFNLSEQEISDIVIQSLKKLSVIRIGKQPKYKVIKIPKCFPVLDSEYKKELTQVSDKLNTITNLTCIGRHGKFQWDGIDEVIKAANYV